GLLERGRRSGDVGPAERGERAVAFAKRAVPLGPASLQPEPQARGQPQLGVICAPPSDRGPVAGALVVPSGLSLAVVEDRFALEQEVHLPVHAANRAQQAMLGL